MARADRDDPRDDVPAAPAMINLSADQLKDLIASVSSEAARQVAAAMAAGSRAPEADATTQATLRTLELLAKSQALHMEEFKRQVRRSNEFHPGFSVFAFDPNCEYCRKRQEHPAVIDAETGFETRAASWPHPKDPLPYTVYFCYNKTREGDLTPVELELYRQFNDGKGDRSVRNGAWRATFRSDGSSRELHIMVPFEGMDVRANLPPLPIILAELLYGEGSVDPFALRRQIDELTRKIAALEAAAEPPAPVAAPAGA